MAANPVIPYPPDILTLDPAWKSCGADANNWGFYDPPRVLTPVSAIAPSPTQGSEGPLFHTTIAGPFDPGNTPVITQSISAQPEAHRTAVAPASVTATKTTEPQPIKTEASNDQPVQPHAPSGGKSVEPFSASIDPPLGATHGEGLGRQSASAGPTVIATSDHQPVHQLPQGSISVAGVAVQEGGPAVTVDNTPVSASVGAVSVGSSKNALLTLHSGLEPAPTVVNGRKLGADTDGSIVLAGVPIPLVLKLPLQVRGCLSAQTTL